MAKNKLLIWGIALILIASILIFAVSNSRPKAIGGDKDSHGCLIGAGYSWCDEKQKCIRQFEEPCESTITYSQAYAIAENSTCINSGSLSNDRVYNSNTKTWWIDMDMKPEFKKEGCSPACVVYEDSNTAEINWRCTGLIPQ
ncbi:MAG: hypothetical protein V1660_02140 [archaeon]